MASNLACAKDESATGAQAETKKEFRPVSKVAPAKGALVALHEPQELVLGYAYMMMLAAACLPLAECAALAAHPQ